MKILSPIISSLLALLVFVSSSSFMVNMHFCGDHMQSISFVEEAIPCPMEVQLPPCHKNMAIQKSGCCQDAHIAFEGKDFNAPVQDISIIPLHATSWVVMPSVIMEVIQENETLTFSNHSLYKPPIAERDIPVLVQSFLL